MTDTRLRLPIAPRLAVGAAAGLLVAAGASGYGLGRAHDDVFEDVGTASSVETQISIQTDDWTYAVPLDVAWSDGGGVQHLGGRPACLPPSEQVIEGVRFAAVPVDSTGIRQVVAVFCS